MEDGNAKSGVFRFKGRCTKIQIRAFTTAVDTDFIFQGKHVSCDADQLVSMFLVRLRVHTGQAAVLPD